MNPWDKLANLFYRVATGDRRRKLLFTPLGLLFFFVLIALFAFAYFWVDEWLDFPSFSSSWWSSTLSILLMVIGSALIVPTVIAFGRLKGTPVPFNPPPKLNTTGLYAYVRNPMLTGIFFMLFGLGVLFSSLSLIFIFTPLFILLMVLELKFVEEKEMEKKFGEEYLEYKKRVPMFIPKLKRVKNERN